MVWRAESPPFAVLSVTTREDLMPSSSTLAAFAVASLLYVAIPGPSVIYITARGISQGRRAAVVSALGLVTGDLVHMTAAAAGIAALVASSVVAFSMLKYVGSTPEKRENVLPAPPIICVAPSS